MKVDNRVRLSEWQNEHGDEPSLSINYASLPEQPPHNKYSN